MSDEEVSIGDTPPSVTQQPSPATRSHQSLRAKLEHCFAPDHADDDGPEEELTLRIAALSRHIRHGLATFDDCLLIDAPPYTLVSILPEDREAHTYGGLALEVWCSAEGRVCHLYGTVHRGVGCDGNPWMFEFLRPDAGPVRQQLPSESDIAPASDQTPKANRDAIRDILTRELQAPTRGEDDPADDVDALLASIDEHLGSFHKAALIHIFRAVQYNARYPDSRLLLKVTRPDSGIGVVWNVYRDVFDGCIRQPPNGWLVDTVQCCQTIQ